VAALSLIVDVRTYVRKDGHFTGFIRSSLRRWPKNPQETQRVARSLWQLTELSVSHDVLTVRVRHEQSLTYFMQTKAWLRSTERKHGRLATRIPYRSPMRMRLVGHADWQFAVNRSDITYSWQYRLCSNSITPISSGFITLPPGEVQIIVMSMSVCLSVCPLI